MQQKKPKVFFSFHFGADAWRASTVRNIGVVEGNEPVKDNDWETVKRGGDAAIKRWIDSQLSGRDCTVVLVGENTADRPWIRHEIVESWNRGMGVVGIRIHKLLNTQSMSCSAGANPFDRLTYGSNGILSSVVTLHDPQGYDSKSAYASISSNIETWVTNAIAMRK